MSIADKISRLSDARDDIITALTNKGVIATDHGFEDFPADIESIVSGSGSAVVVTDTTDSHGGTIREITAVSLEGDTVTPATLLQGVKAHNSLGEPITGELVPSGGGSTLITKNITANGTYYASSDNADGYSSVAVNVPASSPTLQSKTKSYTPSETAQSETVTADSGYDGLDSVEVSVGAISSTYVGGGITRRTSSDLTASGATVTVPAGYYASSASKSVSSGTAGTPTASKGTVSNHSVSVTPSVTNTSGYITGSTKIGTAVTVSASELVSGNKAITENGTNIDVTNYATVSVDVPTSGGSSKNVQIITGSFYTRTTSYTASGAELTVAKTGTYDITWVAWRSTSSGTSGTQIYINNSAYGSAYTTFTGTYGQRITLSNVSLTAGQTVEVYARARGTSYYMYVGALIIEEQ